MEKNKTTTLVLCILLGYLGVHRFYVGKNKSGVLYLLTGGLCGIGWIVDIILICTDKFITPIPVPPQQTQISTTQLVQPRTNVQPVQQRVTVQPVQQRTKFVYIAASGDGKKYHSTPNCTQTKAKRISVRKARSLGYAPCGKCNPPT